MNACAWHAGGPMHMHSRQCACMARSAVLLLINWPSHYLRIPSLHSRCAPPAHIHWLRSQDYCCHESVWMAPPVYAQTPFAPASRTCARTCGAELQYKSHAHSTAHPCMHRPYGHAHVKLQRALQLQVAVACGVHFVEGDNRHTYSTGQQVSLPAARAGRLQAGPAAVPSASMEVA